MQEAQTALPALGETGEIASLVTGESADTAALAVEIGDGGTNAEITFATEGTVGVDSSEGITNVTRLDVDEISTGETFLAENPELNLQFQQSAHEGAEIVDQFGNSYDTMGVTRSFSNPNFSLSEFCKSITGHVLKSNTFTIMNLAGASPAQVAAIQAFIATNLTAVQQASILVVGI